MCKMPPSDSPMQKQQATYIFLGMHLSMNCQQLQRVQKKFKNLFYTFKVIKEPINSTKNNLYSISCKITSADILIK